MQITDKDAARFWSYVDRGPDGFTIECWTWTGFKDDKGYGGFWLAGGTRRAARVAYEVCIGPIPDGLTIDHLCFNRACVNPAHLEAVTLIENVRRAPGFNGRRTHCKHGHPFDEANTRLTATRGYSERVCLACARERTRTRRRAAGKTCPICSKPIQPVAAYCTSHSHPSNRVAVAQ